VLGETRASHIRGGTMEDVIFQGSERRRPLGMGEVTLTLTTDNGYEVAENGRIEINRRVFRSGESEFRLNGKRVRMKDISDILMDTGLGIRNYSVMEQGKIDLILSNKPQDRRKLIEEAAGITRYKTKRRAAELKLEETQANLLRIDDTLAEMSRSLNSLKRQASKARRHEDLASSLSSAKRALYAGRIRQARAEASSSEESVTQAREQESRSAAELAREESGLTERRQQLNERSAAANVLRDEIGRLHAETERVRTFLEQSEQALEELVERGGAASLQLSENQQELTSQQALLDEKTLELETAHAERDQRKEASDELELVRQEAADRVRRHESALSGCRESLMRTIARISEARNQAHQLDIAVEKCEFYLGKLNDASRKVSESRDAARQQASQSEQRIAEAQDEMDRLQETSRQTVEHLQALEQRRENVRSTLAQSRDLISQTTYQIDSLRSLLTSLESQDEAVRRVVLEQLPEARSAAEAIRAAEGFETALDTILRDLTQAVVVDRSDQAIELIRRLHEEGSGRGAFIALDFRANHDEPLGGDLSVAIIGDGSEADAVRAAVPEAYVVETLEDATRQARLRPHATFVTRSGDLVRGSLIIGGKKEESKGIFSVKRQLLDLEHLVENEEARASGIAAELHQLEEDLRQADDARILAQERARHAETSLREMTAAGERTRAELERFEKDFEVTLEEKSLYEEEKSQLLTRKNEALDELASLEESERESERVLHQTEDDLRQARSDFESATERTSHGRVELEAAHGRSHAIEREHENLQRLVRTLEARCQQLRTEIGSIERRKSETDEAVGQARIQREQLVGAFEEARERRVALETEVAELEQAVTAIELAAVAAREQWNAGRDALFEAERRLDRARSSLQSLREQIQLDLHVGIESLGEVEPPATDEEREQIAAEVAELTDKIEKLGPVNVLAIDEYREIEEREGFLRTQRDDLVESIESLRSTIRKINTTSRELFREAFTAVNRNFSEIFTSLFGGGTAGMALLDEEDVLESGIELVAQPPGKRTQSIALLSGGERALTALALLFAIFRYKPSPFCILDEVDAPLDEINNERFVRLLREMSHDTQFIVITHSKRTMEAADVLYGVTMEEAGCSKLVSVSFAEVEG
ncbi:MAG TPA: chromosome segregation protein SMC, partial [Thermoanaerobaculia bacterium]|nr:chromosome segregation protein SMC [Thermoanaerobaculia bacterium]